MLEQMENYVRSVLPAGMPQRKRIPLHDELICHLLDRYEFYREIGFNDEESTQKAIHDMGEDEKTTDYIRNEFDELYFEKTWWAVLVFFGVLMIDLFSDIVFFFGAVSDSDSFSFEIFNAIISFISIAIVLKGIGIAYRHGCRKILTAIGIANILLFVCGGLATLTRILSFPFLFDAVFWEIQYTQAATCAMLDSLFLFLDRCTPLVLRTADCFTLGYNIFGSLLLVAFGIFPFALSFKIRRHGLPRKSKKRGQWGRKIAFIFAAILSVSFYYPADQYFNNYPVWFDDANDTIEAEEQNLYNQICVMQTYEEAETFLNENGYVSTDEYTNTLSYNMSKKFNYDLNQIHFFIEDDYKIFFNPEKVSPTIQGGSYDDRNGFLYLKRAEDGTLCGIGVGNAMYFDEYSHSTYASDPQLCLSAFEEIKTGDSKESVLEKYEEDFGEKVTEFRYITNNGTEEHYRFISEGKGDFHINNSIVTLYVDLHFINGTLSDGKLHSSSYTWNGSIHNHKTDTIYLRQ